MRDSLKVDRRLRHLTGVAGLPNMSSATGKNGDSYGSDQRKGAQVSSAMHALLLCGMLVAVVIFTKHAPCVSGVFCAFLTPR